MNNVIDFTTKMLGLQGIEVIQTDVNNGIFTISVKPVQISGRCPKCGRYTDTVHDVRFSAMSIYPYGDFQLYWRYRYFAWNVVVIRIILLIWCMFLKGTFLHKEHLFFTVITSYDKMLHEVMEMPRAARKKSVESMYHVMSRSISEIDLFQCDEDKSKYLDLLKRYKEKYKCKIYAYCLMSNHVHLYINL